MSRHNRKNKNGKKQSRLRKTHSDRCSNPFNLKNHQGKKRTFRKPSLAMLATFKELNASQVLCGQCRKYPKPDQRSVTIGAQNNVVPSSSNLNEPMTIDIENVSQISRQAKESSSQKINVDVKSKREKDLEEILVKIKNKISLMETNDPLRLRLLTLAPDAWGERKIAREFDVSRRQAKKSKILKEQKGVLGSVCSKRGKSLPQKTVDKVKAFYNDDDNSRVMASTSDTVSMMVNNKKIPVQKRLLLQSLKELHELYKETHPNDPVSFSIFCKLRPKNCILPGSSGTHSTCVCVCHQNVKLMLEAINLKQLSENYRTKLCNYRDCINMMICEGPSDNCFLDKCKKCPGVKKLKNFLGKILEDAMILEVKYALWTDTDRSSLVSVVSTVDAYIEVLCNKMLKLKSHSYVAKKQSDFIKHKKENLVDGEVLVNFDFAENLSYSVQDASQAFHWSNDQCTVFPCIYFYKKNSEIIRKNCIFLSESRKHNTSAVYTIQKKLSEEIKKDLPKIKRIIYVSDGARQHFKNKFQICNLKNHVKEFKIAAEWHFSASAHGKCACDGLGASFKREVFRASMKAKATQALLTIKTVLTWARTNYKGAKIFYFSKSEHDQNQRHLQKRFNDAENVVGISKNHSFIINKNGLVVMREYSQIVPSAEMAKRR